MTRIFIETTLPSFRTVKSFLLDAATADPTEGQLEYCKNIGILLDTRVNLQNRCLDTSIFVL